MLRDDVATKKLPPVKQRLPESPLVVAMDGKTAEPGQHGGTLNMLIGRARDVRMLVVYGYARLIGYDRNLQITPDILEGIEVTEDRIFTMKLRKGHKWSDGQPFTSEDFRYYWEDVANDKDLTPGRHHRPNCWWRAHRPRSSTPTSSPCVTPGPNPTRIFFRAWQGRLRCSSSGRRTT